jgi:tetratricopeptide (TPR) repeat protein
VPGLTVRAHSTTAALKVKSARSAGTTLNVEAVIEGTTRRSGNRVRVSASLVRVSDEAVLWADQFDRENSDLFAVQDTIARAIAGALRVTLTAAAQRQLSTPGTTSPEAHDLVMRGRYLNEQYTEASIRRAIESFDRATRIDSTYADAWSGLVESWALLADDWVAPHDVIPAIQRGVERAVALNPTSSAAHAMRGVLEGLYLRRFQTADQEFKQAIALDSNNAVAWAEYAMLLPTLGLRDSAAAAAHRAIRLDSRSALVQGFSSWTFLLLQRLDEAQQACDRFVELTQNFDACTGLILDVRGRHREAVAAAEKLSGESSEGINHATRALVLARAGRANDARRELAFAVDYSRRHYVREEMIARAYAALGDKDNSFAWLERLVASDGSYAVWLRLDPFLASLRSDQLFESIARRAGLP